MKRALAYARRGAGFTKTNPMVGAVIVNDGEIVGYGWHEKHGEAHAEVNALEMAGEKAKGATIYVTLEPCNHHGLTGPCTEAIINAGLAKVVFAMFDPNPKVCGRGAKTLQDAGLEVCSGVLEKEAHELNLSWLSWVAESRPYVLLKLAISADGKVGSRKRQIWLSSKVARAQVHRLRSLHDAIMVGSGTLAVDDPLLTNRSSRQGTPLRVIIDTELSSSTNARVFNSEGGEVIVFCKKDVDPEKVEKFITKGVTLVFSSVVESGVDLAFCLKHLARIGIKSVLCEGGARLAESLLKAKLCDRVMLYNSDVLIGADGVQVPGVTGRSLDYAYQQVWSKSLAGDSVSLFEAM